MNININRTREDEVLCIKLKRSLTSRNANKNIFLFFALGIILTVFTNKDNFKDNSFSTNTLFGMIFFGFAIILSYQNYILKARKFQIAINVIKQYNGDKGCLRVIFNDDSFSLETFRNYHRYYWTAVNMFRIYKGYIILLNNSEYYYSLVIKKSELSQEEFDELYAFLKSQNLKEL